MKTFISQPFNIQSFIISKKTFLSPFISEDDFDFNSFNNWKRFISIFYISKKKLLKLEFLNIAEIDINPYHYLIKNKNNKLFFVIINEIYNNLTLYIIK